MAMEKLVVLILLVTGGSTKSEALPIESHSATHTDLTASEHSICPEGWKDFNDRCFKFFPQILDWATAEVFCVAQGGNLASVHSAEENQFLKNLSKAVDPQENIFWIGMTDCQKEGTWLWSDGSKVDYLVWNSGEPNNAHNSEACVHSYSSEKHWNDNICARQFSFICVNRSDPARKK